jgi:hypothetical protein
MRRRRSKPGLDTLWGVALLPGGEFVEQSPVAYHEQPLPLAVAGARRAANGGDDPFERLAVYRLGQLVADHPAPPQHLFEGQCSDVLAAFHDQRIVTAVRA